MTQLHGVVYSQEYSYGVSFEAYVAKGLAEYYITYDENLDRCWIAEKDGKVAGFIFLQHREEGCAQLRYFLILPEYRGQGLGKQLTSLFMEFLVERKYQTAYLWTTSELHTAAHCYKSMGFKLVEEVPSEVVFGKKVVEQKYELIL